MDDLKVDDYVTVGNAELIYRVLGFHGTRVWIVSGNDYYRTVEATFLKPVE